MTSVADGEPSDALAVRRIDDLSACERVLTGAAGDVADVIGQLRRLPLDEVGGLLVSWIVGPGLREANAARCDELAAIRDSLAATAAAAAAATVDLDECRRYADNELDIIDDAVSVAAASISS